MDPKERLVNYLYGPIEAAILQWQPQPRSDIYGIWLNLGLAEDNPCLPEVSFVAYLSQDHTTDALIASYGSAFSSGCMTGEIVLNLCEESGAWYGDPDHPGDPEGRSLRNAYFATVGVPSSTDSGSVCLEAFLEVCGEVIRRLHQEGIISSVCGRPVPVGMTFSNDVDDEIALAPTRDANLPGLSREMEEWMMGMTYAEKAARERFFAEVAAQPTEEQARFWIEALIAYQRKLHGKQESEPAARLSELRIDGMRDIDPRFCSPVGLAAVPQLLSELERWATARRAKPDEPGYVEKWITTGITRALRQAGSSTEGGAGIADEDVSRLYCLLTRLFREGEFLEDVDIITDHIAGILNVFRPQRYPTPISGHGGAQANRLLNWRGFGLEKANPDTPEYSPDRAVLEEAYSAFRHRVKQDVQ